ncbi:hypothetical protein F5Y07DRAFT_131489 [Xylaria sp. FL0933]|nr:hypothetical protein F5Y07DRAFT_131489 [Xylaria sp. FL0933]
MPPLYSEKRCPQKIGRHRRVSSVIARPTLLIRETLDNGDDEDADESDENISPDADKSSLRFTLERRRDNGDNDEDNNDGPGRNRGFGGDNPQSRQNGRQGDGPGDGPRFFHEKADGGDNKGGKGDGNPFNNGPGPGPGPGPGNNNNINNNNNNDNDNNDDNNNNNNNNNDGDGGKGGSSNDNGNRGGNNGDGSGGDNNDDGRDGNKDGNGRGNGGGNGSDSNSDDNNSSTSPPPPPSSSTTSTSSTVEATTTTSDVIPTPSVVFTTSVITSVTTPETTTVSSTSPESIITTLTALPDSADPSDIPIFKQPAVSSSLTPGVSLSTSISDSSSPVPTPTEGANNRGNGNNSHGKNGNKINGGNNRGPGGGLTSTTEPVLVAIGAIGIFIVLCFILWLVVRTLKKSKRSGRKYNDSSWLAGLIPGRKQPKPSNAPGFNSFYEKESLPAYDAGGKNSMEGYGYYDQTKLYPLEPENVSYPPAAAAAVRLQNEIAMRQVAESQQRQLLPNSVSQYPPQLNVQIGDSYNNDVNSTLRSRMPDAYYTQSQLSRQPSNAYNPTQRQVYRASEISSLSSGFGDGDIIMPPPNVIMTPKPPTAAVAAAPRAPTNAEGNGNNRPFSWMSRAGTEQKRDTVYTTASDRRTRFHSVNSWVDQQKRRLMKAS